MSKILLFIPFYNCENQISRVLNQVKLHHQHFHKILLVENRSQDQGLSKAKQSIEALSLENVIIVQNEENYNLGGSHKVAFQYATKNDFSHVVVFHGDDQADLSDLTPFIQNQTYSKYDCLLGARFHPHSKLLGYSKFRTYGNIIVNSLCRISCRRKILDMGSGLNMYSKTIFSNDDILSFPNDLTFNVYLLFHSCFLKNNILFFPIKWREEDQISNAKVFRQFLIILKLIVSSFFKRSSIYKNTTTHEYRYEIIFKN